MDVKPKLLLVEDRREVAEIVVIVFESAGYEVVSRDTVEDALAAIDKHPDITEALVDASLYVKGFCNTIPVVQKLKANGVKRIVAISGHPDTQTELMQAGCTEGLPKPFSLPQLMALAARNEASVR